MRRHANRYQRRRAQRWARRRARYQQSHQSAGSRAALFLRLLVRALGAVR